MITLDQVVSDVVSDVRRWWKTPAPPIRRARVPVWFPEDGLDGSESTYAADEQNQARPILEHGIDTGNFDVLYVPVLSAGFVGVFDVNGDGISLVSRCLDSNGAQIESSQSARLYIRVNSERAIGLPFSYLNDQNGAQKCDLLSLTARVQRVWIYVDIPTQDANQSYIVLAFTKGVAVSGLFGSAGLAGGIPSSPSVTTAGGGAGAASGGGTGGTGGTGGIGGGGYSGGGGGGQHL